MNWKKCREFVEEMENPFIIYHKDADGVCSASLMEEFISGNALPNDGPGIGITDDLLEIIKDSKDVIFLDLPVDQLSVVEELEAERVFILDHHPPERDLTGDRVLHVNPRFENPDSYLPAAYLCYKLVEEELGEVAWKGGVGVVGDHGVEQCKELIKVIEEENRGIISKGKYDYDSLKDGTLGEIADMISASKVIEGITGIKRSFKVIREADGPEDVFESELPDLYRKYKTKLEDEERKFERDAEYFSSIDAYLYQIQSKSSLASNLSTRLANENPDSIIIMYQKKGMGMNISGRCQSGRIDISEIMREAVGDMGKAGGHPQAAGGFVEKGKEEVVIQRLREKLEDLG